jgi:hypothetical protein
MRHDGREELATQWPTGSSWPVARDMSAMSLRWQLVWLCRRESVPVTHHFCALDALGTRLAPGSSLIARKYMKTME